MDPHTVTLDGKKITAKYILVAVGGWPLVPEFPGSEYVITSNEAFYLPSLPETVIIVGGGYIGVEFAGIFHGLGAHTIQLYRGESFLRGFDDDIRTALAAEMLKRGIDLRFEADISRIDKAGEILHATLTDGSVIQAEQILYATGRLPKTRGLGLENAGVKLSEFGAVDRRRIFAVERREHLCHRGLYRPDDAHAGRHRRGDSRGQYVVQS